MIENFKIRRGLSTELFNVDGSLKSNAILELGCWYLCTDTVTVYICVREADKLTLKQLNSKVFGDRLDTLERLTTNISSEIDGFKNLRLYQKIDNEADLPKNFDSPDFNPNIAYYEVKDEQNKVASLFVFDSTIQDYLCINKANLDIVEADIEALIDKKINIALEDAVPELVKDSLVNVILHGGTAIPAANI